MNFVELTKELVCQVVCNPDMVSVKEFEAEEDNEIVIQVLVAQEDMGRVIGKNGKIANAIRILVQAASYVKESKRVKINIDSF